MSESQTIIAIPSDISDIAQLRQFLVRLVIELDIVIGYRGSNSDSLQSLADRVTALENSN